jgi:hypothetical protein
MVTAGRILGDQVGSTAPAFLAILAIHVIAGLAAVITGAVAALARKGTGRHIRAGRWYYRAIATVFVSATGLAVMRWRQDYHLFIVGAVAFAAATIGYLHRRLRRPGDTGHITGMGVAYTAMLTAFYVDNGPHLPLWDRLPAVSFWFLPAVIATPILTRSLIRASRNQARLEQAPRRPAGIGDPPQRATRECAAARRRRVSLGHGRRSRATMACARTAEIACPFAHRGDKHPGETRRSVRRPPGRPQARQVTGTRKQPSSAAVPRRVAHEGKGPCQWLRSSP